jgi:hypothetical protein
MSKTKRKVPRVPNRRVSSTENVAAKPVADSENEPSQNKTNLPAPSSDGPTLPSLYEAAINPEGGITLASHDNEDADGVSKRNKKRRKSGAIDVGAQAEEEAIFAPMPADVQRNLNALVDTMGASVPTYIKQLVPWELLPRKVNSDVEKRVGADFWLQNTISVPIHTNAKITSMVNRLKNYLGVDKKDFPKELLPPAGAPEDLVLSIMAQGPGTAKLASVFQIAKRVIAPGEVNIHDRVEKWYSYTQLASKIVEKKRKFDAVREYLSDFEEGSKLSNKQRKSKFERAMKRLEEAKNNTAQADKMDLSEEEAFEPVDSTKEPKSKAVPILIIWISRKPIQELKEAFGEEEVYATKRAWEGPREIKVPKGKKDKKGDEKKSDKDAAKNGVKKDAKDADGDEEILDFDAVEGIAPQAERDDMDL